MILTPFHPVVVIGLGKNLLFKSVLAHCATLVKKLFMVSIHRRKTNAELYEFFKVLPFQKRIVVAATILGNTVCYM